MERKKRTIVAKSKKNIQEIDLTKEESQEESNDESNEESQDDDEDDYEEDEEEEEYATKRTKTMKKVPEKKEEKRLAVWRSSASKSVRDRIERAQSQRMFLISRSDKSEHEKQFVVLGSVGNVYQVVISTLPTCSCPDFQNGNLCKHILFVFLKVLKVKANSPLIYQKALLTTELEEIFDKAPKNPSVLANQQVLQKYKEALNPENAKEEAKVQQRKIEGDCPICYEEMSAKEKTVWCQSSCGNNMHEHCFNEWAKSLRSRHETVTCVYCRADWNAKEKEKSKTSTGFLNLGKYQPEIPTERDTSTYSSYDRDRWGGRGRYRNRRWHSWDEDDEEGDEEGEEDE